MTQYDLPNLLPPPEQNSTPWLLIYLGLSLLTAFTTLAYIGVGYYASLQAGRHLFSWLLRRLIHAPSRFFDVTPLGRILNRFTADMSTIDSQILGDVQGAISGFLTFISSFLFIAFVIPGFAPIAVLIAWLFVRMSPKYIRASRDL
jgi:ABC-type multidrug transport system fused ATPase/permease subunit